MTQVLLHQTVDLEPVGSPPITRSRFGHAHHQTFSEAACLAGGPVLLVHHALVVVLALLDDGLVVAGATKERLAALASEGSKVESCSRLLANATQLILHGIQAVQLEKRIKQIVKILIASDFPY